MQIRCPSCGAEMSLETVIDNDAAAQALVLALSFTPLGKLIVRYLAMFRPAKSKLSWPRVVTLLGELMPMIESQRIERNGTLYEAPHEVWCKAIEQMLAARDMGTLQTPLKSHGYLLEVIVSTASKAQTGTAVGWVNGSSTHQHKPQSGTAAAITALEQRKRGER
ncbi:MAG: hypothetical protein WAS93_07775 [Burkholderiaceae bacterium]